MRRQASNPGTCPWDIGGAGCLWGPRVSPPKWQCKGIRGHDNELCASPERGVKRGNFWNDGCRRWCPICFSSLEFTASAALCKQLGSKTGCSAIPPPFSFFFLMLSRQCPSENIILDFSGEILHCTAVPIVWMPILQFLPVHLSLVTEQNCCAKCLQGATVACISTQGLRMPLWAGVLWIVVDMTTRIHCYLDGRPLLWIFFTIPVGWKSSFKDRDSLLSKEYSTSNT